MFFNVLATFAEIEGYLIRLRTREGMAIARAKGKLRGKQPKLSEKKTKRALPYAGNRPVLNQRSGGTIFGVTTDSLPNPGPQ